MSSSTCYKSGNYVVDMLKQSQRLLYSDSKKCMAPYCEMKDVIIDVKKDIVQSGMDNRVVDKKYKINEYDDIV